MQASDKPVQTAREVVEAIYGAFGKGDLKSVYEVLSPDVLWTSYGPQEWPTSRAFEGVEGAKLYFELNGKLCNPTVFTPGKMYFDGDAVIVQGYESGIMTATSLPPENNPATAVPMENNWTHIWEVQNGLVARFTEYICNVVHYPAIATA